MIPMKKLAIALLLICALVYLFPRKVSTRFLSFDASMVKANPSFDLLYDAEKGQQWKFVKKLYEKYLKAKPSKNRIPKIIHQIWLGGPLPKKYEALQKSWIEMHPDWEYYLWSDADVPDFPFVNRERFEKAVNVGEKADIFRYEILNLHGGLYVDTDFECIRSFDVLHDTCDLYAGILGAYENDQEVYIGNALIGSVPQHPILQACIKRIAEKAPGKTPDEVQAISGPGCFKWAFFKCRDKSKHLNVAFPFTFFYPLPPHEKCGFLDPLAKNQWIEPETFGIHYWDTSWGDQKF